MFLSKSVSVYSRDVHKFCFNIYRTGSPLIRISVVPWRTLLYYYCSIKYLGNSWVLSQYFVGSFSGWNLVVRNMGLVYRNNFENKKNLFEQSYRKFFNIRLSRDRPNLKNSPVTPALKISLFYLYTFLSRLRPFFLTIECLFSKIA